MCKNVRDLVYPDDRLGMRKLIARWVRKSLSDEQMATRACVYSALLKRYRSKDEFLLRLVTVDETWVHYDEPENKESSVGRAWVPKANQIKDTTICWQCDGHSFLGGRKGVIMLDILPKRSTITGEYYANVLDQLKTAIRENAEVNSLKVICCNKTTRESTLAKLQLML